MELLKLKPGDRFQFPEGEYFNPHVVFVLISLSDDFLRARISGEWLLGRVSDEVIECNSIRKVLKIEQ